jgi:LPXTG-motif cell wall-anchored protein
MCRFYCDLQSGGTGVNTRRKIAAMVAGAALTTAVLVTGASSLAGAVAIPGDPTPAECAVIAQQAIDKGISFAQELANQGGGNCPTPAVTTISSTVLGNTVVNAVTTSKPTTTVKVLAGGTLPKSGGNATGTLVAGGILVLLGGTLVLVNRRRTTPE